MSQILASSDTLIALLQRSTHRLAEDARIVDAFLALLRETDHPFAREQYEPGHITASGLVVTADRSILLVRHRRLARWLQPGGHLEPADSGVEAAARREIQEETGVRVGPAEGLIGLDIHEIPAARGEPAHLHHDICFLFLTQRQTVVRNNESTDAAWWTPRDVEQHNLDDAVQRYARRALALPNSTFPSS